MRNTLISLALLAVLFARSAVAQTSKSPVGNYPQIQEYLMPQASEIALAKSAAPANISDGATNYERFSMPWKLAMCDVDAEPVVIILQRGADTWTPYSIVRLSVIGQHIDRVVDYVHCSWVISMADSVTVVAHP